MKTCEKCGCRIAKASDLKQCMPCWTGRRVVTPRFKPEDVPQMKEGMRVKYVPHARSGAFSKFTGTVVRVGTERIQVQSDDGQLRTVSAANCMVITCT